MRTISLFMFTSIDGFFAGPDHDISWHNFNEEMGEFSTTQMAVIDTLLFGRVTYEFMASYWPTPMAVESDAEVAGQMNSVAKVVVSTTLDKAEWNNTRLIKENVAEEIAALKRRPGKEIAIFGSSDLATSLLELGLLDQIRIMVNPVILGSGKLLFSGISGRPKLLSSRAFSNGNVLLTYEPER